MKLVILPTAAKGLVGLQPKLAVKLVERLEAIAAQPFVTHPNVERMRGEHDAFRLRQGDWRAVYWLDRERQELRVVRIEPRGGVYK